MVDIPYRSLVGSLMYLAVCTRPDLSMAVSALSRCSQNPQMVHWEAAKRVLRYFKGTAGEGLGYSPGEEIEIWGYSDASYGSDEETKLRAVGLSHFQNSERGATKRNKCGRHCDVHSTQLFTLE